MAFKITFAEVLFPENVKLTPLPQLRRVTLTPKAKAKLAKWDTAKSGRLIRKAAEVMAGKGYTTGSLGSPTQGLCVRGAVNYAWCGNSQVTDTGQYLDSGPSGFTFDYQHSRAVRNIEIIKALTDFRDYLKKNHVYASVEDFNDQLKNKDEVIRWMHKYADDVDPQK